MPARTPLPAAMLLLALVACAGAASIPGGPDGVIRLQPAGKLAAETAAYALASNGAWNGGGTATVGAVEHECETALSAQCKYGAFETAHIPGGGALFSWEFQAVLPVEQFDDRNAVVEFVARSVKRILESQFPGIAYNVTRQKGTHDYLTSYARLSHENGTSILKPEGKKPYPWDGRAALRYRQCTEGKNALADGGAEENGCKSDLTFKASGVSLDRGKMMADWLRLDKLKALKPQKPENGDVATDALDNVFMDGDGDFMLLGPSDANTGKGKKVTKKKWLKRMAKAELKTKLEQNVYCTRDSGAFHAMWKRVGQDIDISSLNKSVLEWFPDLHKSLKLKKKTALPRIKDYYLAKTNFEAAITVGNQSPFDAAKTNHVVQLDPQLITTYGDADAMAAGAQPQLAFLSFRHVHDEERGSLVHTQHALEVIAAMINQVQAAVCRGDV